MHRHSNAGGILSTGCQGRGAHHFGGALKSSGDHRLAASQGTGDEHLVICALEHVHAGPGRHRAGPGEGNPRPKVSAFRLRRRDEQGSHGSRDPEVDSAD